MEQRPFPRLAGAFLLAVAAFVCPGAELLSVAQAPAQVDFAGMWDGEYVDNLKNTGQGVYQFHEGKNGQLTGTVSWYDLTKKLQKMELKGERLGADAMRLTGAADGTTYRYIGGMQGGVLVLAYTSEKEKSAPGFGVSRLTRQQPKK